MMSFFSRWGLIAILVVILALAGLAPARAADSDLEKARDLTNRAIELYQAGRYDEAGGPAREALDYWEKNYGPHDPIVAAGLSLLANIYTASGKLAQAEPLFQRALAIEEKSSGPESLGAARQANNLGALLYRLGAYDRAEPLYKRALAIREKTLGPDHPDVGVTVNNLAALYDARGDLARAEPLYQRTLSIREKQYGPDDHRVAVALNNLATLYDIKGDYTRAEPLYKRALAIREKVLGPDHPDVAESLNNLASLYDAQGYLARAEPLYERALALREKILGPDHPDVAISLNNLAQFHADQGRFAQAAAEHERALNIRRKVLGPNHPEVAQSLNNLGLVFESLGQPARAEAALLEARDIWIRTLGREHLEVATVLNNLAQFQQSLGDYDRAEPLARETLAIREKVLGPDHADVALALNNLAGLALARRKPEEARPWAERAVHILEKALGPDHPRLATGLGTLAAVHFAVGDKAGALALNQRALVIREKALRPDHPDIAASLNNLAGSALAAGDLELAESNYARAARIIEQAYGPEHPENTKVLSNLAVVVAARGRYQEALKLWDGIQELDQRFIDQIMGFTAQEQKTRFLAVKQRELYACLSLVAGPLKDDPAARLTAFNAWLRRKGVALETERRFQEALFFRDAPEVRQVFQELAGIRARLSQLAFAGPGRDDPAAYRRRLAELETRSRDLEARLGRLSQAYAIRENVARARADQVAGTLPAGSVLLDLARIDLLNLPGPEAKDRWQPAHYLAFILQAGTPVRVELVNLGPALEIDQALAELKAKLADTSDLTGRAAEPAARKLHDLVFAPLREKIGQARNIFLSPDGNLNLIPFEVLRGPDGRFLIDDYTFNYLSAGRDVLELKPSSGGPLLYPDRPAILMGDPDFDLGPPSRSAALTRLGLVDAAPPQTNQEPPVPSRDLRGLAFSPLAATRTEILAIQGILGANRARTYLGPEVLEEVISREAPPILHLATHGFFLRDLVSRPALDQGTGAFADQAASPSKDTVIRIENPWIRSGLALAGANQTLAGQPGSGGGLLTAEKVLSLNLTRTDLVVLSACETGLGQVESGEGVYGLRRALAQAGAKTLVLSQWSVADQETQELMVEFYRQLTSGGVGRAQALRQAALKEKQIVQARYGGENPLFWGAFILVGQP